MLDAFLKQLQLETSYQMLKHILPCYHISHMTPVALLQDRAGAGPNEPTSSQFLELG